MKENVIYYFSGTGNSLDIARTIGENLGDTQYISMKREPGLCSCFHAKRVGFVYPTYMFTLPSIVERFVKHIRLDEHTYIFSISTSGLAPGNSIARMNHILSKRDYYLSYGASIYTVANNITRYPVANNVEELLEQVNVNLLPIIEDLITMKSNVIPKEKLRYRWLSNGLKKFPQLDRNFEVDSRCNSCGLCRKICPVANIEYIDGRPVFLHRCEQCMACIHFCPKEAINYKDITKNRTRYHNPNITPEDLF